MSSFSGPYKSDNEFVDGGELGKFQTYLCTKHLVRAKVDAQVYLGHRNLMCLSKH